MYHIFRDIFPKRFIEAKVIFRGHSRSSTTVVFDKSQYYDFLLVLYTNDVFALHRFQNITLYVTISDLDVDLSVDMTACSQR